MPGADFLDTNVLVYAYQLDDPHKHRVAKDFVKRAALGNFVISTQVLSEFASTLLRKASPPATPQDVIAILDGLSAIKVIAPDGSIVRRAVEAQALYGLHLYDGMIVAAAERAGSQQIWSEDFDAGQKYFGVTVRNPFP
jgi:predicted nucleic acid-binding protein